MKYTLRISEYSGVFSVSLLGPLQSDGGSQIEKPVASTTYLAGELGLQDPDDAEEVNRTFEASLLSPKNLSVELESNQDEYQVECRVLSSSGEEARELFMDEISFSQLSVVPRNSFRTSPSENQSSLDDY